MDGVGQARLQARCPSDGGAGPDPPMRPLAWCAVVLAFVPLAAKRIALLGEPAFDYWLAWDYGARCVMLTGVMLGYRTRLIRALPTRASLLVSAIVFVAALSIERLEQLYLGPILQQYLPYFQYARTPLIQNRELILFDLFFGIWLVAISEELVFRRFLFALLDRLAFGKSAILLISSALFGLVHVTTGLNEAVSAFLHGIMLGLVFFATRRLALCIVLHYIDDFLIFGRAAADSGLWGPPMS
jgi:hypothetical protein